MPILTILIFEKKKRENSKNIWIWLLLVIFLKIRNRFIWSFKGYYHVFHRAEHFGVEKKIGGQNYTLFGIKSKFIFSNCVKRDKPVNS